MRRIPGQAQVDRALKGATREVKSATKRVNQQASKLMARGDYEGAQAWVELGRTVLDFLGQVEELRAKWKGLRAATPSNRGKKGETTPVWRLYTPILRIIMSSGGQASWGSIQDALEQNSEFQPLPGDVDIVRGKPKWTHTAYRARRGMAKEGFIEKRGKTEWRITAAGRKAAESAAGEVR